MAAVQADNGVPLRQLLVTLGEPLLRLHTPDANPIIRGIAVLDPHDEPGHHGGELVLIVGARGRRAARVAQAAADAGAAAVAVKKPPTDLSLQPAGVAVLGVAPDLRWHQLAALVQDVLDEAALTDGNHDGFGDLFAVAQSLAILAAGNVTIEDAGNRVLAYSRSDDVDELRRLSILGWRGPDNYLSLLREWGVFQQLRAGDDVVHVDERPELGIRARLAVGIRAGNHHLGTIWVQQGPKPFAAGVERALQGAARVAAVHLLRQRVQPGSTPEQLVAGLLDGHGNADLVAGQLGLDPTIPVTVVAFDTREPEPDQATHELHRNQITTMITMHLLAHRRRALVGRAGPRIYAIIPQAPDPTGMVRGIIDVLSTRTGIPVQAGIGSAAPTLHDVAASRTEADRALDTLRPDTTMASITDLRADVILAETRALLTAKPDLRDPKVTALIDHDTTHGADLVATLLVYLDALGDVATAAAALRVHPNTVRHRIRRATTISGINLDDPRQRLACHLQLLTTQPLNNSPAGPRDDHADS
ncbi:PucR family transcriptional regulator [Phytohabitans kaempferiae]|uniref:PucR family transcriptional regulator n=1 Tax=Phytohabitans kaempferiae TaxID=1620943 RepID=A0ABV6MDL3_9ACTN